MLLLTPQNSNGRKLWSDTRSRCNLQATKLPTAVLSTTKKSKERAKKKAAAKAAGKSGSLGEAASMDVDEPAKASAEGPTKEEEAKAAEEEAAKKKAEEEAEAAKCPFEMENPARCAPYLL